MRTAALLALAGSAAAFSPMMSMDVGRRQIVQAGAAAGRQGLPARALQRGAGSERQLPLRRPMECQRGAVPQRRRR